MYFSPLEVRCIKIPVKESPFDITVRHISSLTSFSFIVELVFYFSEKGKPIVFSPLLFTGTCESTFETNLGQPYVRLTSKSKDDKKGSYA